MDKSLILSGSYILGGMILVLISYVINLSFIHKIRKKDGYKNLIFGLQITLIGVVAFYVKYNYTYLSLFWSVVINFIPIYILTTGFMFSLIGYFDNK